MLNDLELYIIFHYSQNKTLFFIFILYFFSAKTLMTTYVVFWDIEKCIAAALIDHDRPLRMPFHPALWNYIHSAVFSWYSTGPAEQYTWSTRSALGLCFAVLINADSRQNDSRHNVLIYTCWEWTDCFPASVCWDGSVWYCSQAPSPIFNLIVNGAFLSESLCKPGRAAQSLT